MVSLKIFLKLENLKACFLIGKKPGSKKMLRANFKFKNVEFCDEK